MENLGKLQSQITMASKLIKLVSIITLLSDPHHDICFHGEEHVAMVVGFVVLDVACVSSGLGLLF